MQTQWGQNHFNHQPGLGHGSTLHPPPPPPPPPPHFPSMLAMAFSDADATTMVAADYAPDMRDAMLMPREH